ncbi:hypothetical protein [Planococcus salinarum]|uniref:hypothetical protein n=1 Tax=Planococcus salinarum TaxID=622695 RepID=UPI000E3DF93B|nr:hypothetical protein [Planococcus salinarum]TAA72389.1 hypothetical protein D2909_06410 [Planococcus salinarum]
MKHKRIYCLLILCILIPGMAACTFAPYTVDNEFTGTIEELITEEKFLFDDKFLEVKEYGGESEGRRAGNIYEIPVDSFEEYEVGQRVKVTVLTNYNEDVWDSERMKFEITIID